MSIVSRIGWGLMTFLSLGVGGYAVFMVATGFKFIAPEIMGNHFPSPLGIETHIAASGFALILGPFQFLKGLRRKFAALHRWSGRLYVAACTIGGLAGLAIGLFSTSGAIAGWGFFTLAIFWLTTTQMAWISAMRRDFAAHERWMIRSFALTLAAVTLRIYLPPAVIAAQGAFPVEAYRVIAWACWVPNLLIAEIWIRAGLSRPRRVQAA